MAIVGLTNIFALFPVLWATGTGADVMKRLAAPMIGGVASAMLLTLFVIPAIHTIWYWHTEDKNTIQQQEVFPASLPPSNE